MNGPEHYRAAERLVSRAMLTDDDVEAGQEDNLAAAQVHATLALAAAMAGAGRQVTPELRRQWLGATGC